ncbi:hypothetical protein BCBBV1cgp17 [Bacillus phage BCASJ1c]|uniref:17 n=1 Tax=Bacillus phage BCASJ1c TaxID=294382 RepID=Q5YA93_9CAUD|nr:hypothetical protein BCBBV1cgp17 [Bacillus phage BCASJ1c]AAU85064.1 17 [Bacillus phage BCASJ1c]
MWKSEVVVTQWTPEQIKNHLTRLGVKDMEVTKERYMDLRRDGLKEKEIATEMGIKPAKLSHLKNNKCKLRDWEPETVKLKESPQAVEKAVDKSSVNSEVDKLHYQLKQVQDENAKMLKENGDLKDQLYTRELVIKKQKESLEESYEKIDALTKANEDLDKEMVRISKDYRELKVSLQTPAITQEDYEMLQQEWRKDSEALILSRQDCDELKKTVKRCPIRSRTLGRDVRQNGSCLKASFVGDYYGQ